MRTTTDWKRLRQIWNSMKSRCSQPGRKYYYDKGIRVCDGWVGSFDNFYAWSMDHGYYQGMSIDRISNDLGYSPGNCRWATKQDQSRNKTNVIKVETVRLIKKMLKEGLRIVDIAELTSTSYPRVSSIKAGRTWSDV